MDEDKLRERLGLKELINGNSTTTSNGNISDICPSQVIITQTKLSFDEALEAVGSGNWYQYRAFVYFGLQWFFAAWILLGSQFILFPAEFDKEFCAGLTTEDCQSKVCATSNPLEYMTNRDTSMIGSLNLVCEELEVSVIQSSAYVGSLFGFFLFSWIADNQGRKKALFIAWFCASLSALFIAFSWDFYSATASFFLAGFGVNPAITVLLSILSEHSLGKFREYSTIGVQVGYAVGECALIGVAYYVPDWKLMTFYFLAIPMIFLNLGILFIHESPKYVYEKDHEKAVMILNKIAKTNGKQEIDERQVERAKRNEENGNTAYSVKDLFKYRSLRKNTVFTSLIFFSIQAIYYGVSFSMSKIGLNLYTNSIIIAVAETFAYLITDHFIPKLRRRPTMIFGMALCSCLSLCYQFLNSPIDCDLCTVSILQIVFASIIRFSICFVWAVCYVYVTELFPTTVKSLALGVISGAGTIGSSTAPYIGNVSQSLGISPMISLGFIGLMGMIASIPLEETIGLPLLNQIKELNIHTPTPMDNDTLDVFTEDYSTREQH